MSFRAVFRAEPRFRAGFAEAARFVPVFGEHVEVPKVDWYDGDYRFTPTAAEQTVSVTGKTMRRDIVIGPVPSNYGLITWNGSTITVS